MLDVYSKCTHYFLSTKVLFLANRFFTISNFNYVYYYHHFDKIICVNILVHFIDPNFFRSYIKISEYIFFV